jgi:hypothetical protein
MTAAGTTFTGSRLLGAPFGHHIVSVKQGSSLRSDPLAGGASESHANGAGHGGPRE